MAPFERDKGKGKPLADGDGNVDGNGDGMVEGYARPMDNLGKKTACQYVCYHGPIIRLTLLSFPFPPVTHIALLLSLLLIDG
jgi:hypothetical protein